MVASAWLITRVWARTAAASTMPLARSATRGLQGVDVAFGEGHLVVGHVREAPWPATGCRPCRGRTPAGSHTSSGGVPALAVEQGDGGEVEQGLARPASHGWPVARPLSRFPAPPDGTPRSTLVVAAAVNPRPACCPEPPRPTAGWPRRPTTRTRGLRRLLGLARAGRAGTSTTPASTTTAATGPLGPAHLRRWFHRTCGLCSLHRGRVCGSLGAATDGAGLQRQVTPSVEAPDAGPARAN